LRDYARFGYFFMHGAKIDGTAILPEGWIADATLSHIKSGWRGVGYGYQWWINPDGPYRAIGIYGQTIYLDPRSDIVIVTNSAWPEADWDPGYDAFDAFALAVTHALRGANPSLCDTRERSHSWRPERPAARSDQTTPRHPLSAVPRKCVEPPPHPARRSLEIPQAKSRSRCAPTLDHVEHPPMCPNGRGCPEGWQPA